MAPNSSEIQVAARLDDYFGRLGRHLKDKRSRESFALYAIGLLGDGDRKSAEPIAARLRADPRETHNLHSKLCYFLGRSVWDDLAVRREAARYALDELARREPITTWIIDDTGFLKQGKHSVGVQRQYTGSAGKITNCQIGVSLCAATATEQLPLDFELYLPKTWTEDAARRNEAKIPDAVAFKTKIELALDMIERAVRDEVPGEIILADAAYGDSTEFRDTVRLLGFDFAVGIQSSLGVVELDAQGRVRGSRETARELAERLGSGAFRRVTWRSGSKAELSSRFCFVRVRTTHDDGVDLEAREPVWLVAEWPEGEAHPTKFFLTTLPQRLSKKQIVRTIKERFRTERMYEDLKGELGLDHFEGRSYPGWHHHVSIVLCCYAFIIAERLRAFPPSAARSRDHGALDTAA